MTTSRHFLSSASYAAATADTRPAIALVTGGKSGIGYALAHKIASFPFIEYVLTVSRRPSSESDHPKITSIAADLGTEEGRKVVVNRVHELCSWDNNDTRKQLRYLVHSAGTVQPIKAVWDVQSDELRQAMMINCEAPFLLTTALYKYMQKQPATATSSGGNGNNSTTGVAGRVLHVSSGAAHGAPPVGWGVYGMTKAAFFQSFRVLEREFRQDGNKVIVGSFKPGVVDTDMQGTIRNSSDNDMPAVQNFRSMKEKVQTTTAGAAHPPPSGALDTPENVGFFAEFLLTGTTDEEFANANDPNEWDIRNKENYERWILPENIPADP